MIFPSTENITIALYDLVARSSKQEVTSEVSCIGRHARFIFSTQRNTDSDSFILPVSLICLFRYKQSLEITVRGLVFVFHRRVTCCFHP